MTKKSLLSLLILLLPLVVGALFVHAALAARLSLDQEDEVYTLNSGHQFLPPYTNPRDRFGFDAGERVTNYTVEQLHAGWYSDWVTKLSPPHPDGLTYVQLVRFNAGADPQDPAQVTVSPSPEIIAQIADAHPGSLWLLGNEPDSFYCGSPIYPWVYAHVYHDLHTTIKALDPTALIANGGIVQPTPCRLEYLDIVWDTYVQAYGEPMPVDVWNTHAFILREVYGSWGASTPPGVDPSCAMDYPVRDGDNVDILRDHVIAMRQWMKDKGEQGKPLIISEYGVLWPEWFADEDGRTFPPVRVSHFMTQTFELFLGETYPEVGHPEDEYRLVQAWAWYSLSDDQNYNGYLFHSDSGEISPMGQTYANYTEGLSNTLYVDLTPQLWVDLNPLRQLTPTVPYDSPTATLPVTGVVANLAQISATGVTIAAPQLDFELIQDIPPRYAEDIATLPLPTFVITQPGEHNLTLIADPDQEVADARRWNNTSNVIVDARADLLVLSTDWKYHSPTSPQAKLPVTPTVSNAGLWPTPPVSGTLYLSNSLDTLGLLNQPFSVPALGSGDQVTLTLDPALPSLDEDIYRLTVNVESNGTLDEQEENNNQVEMAIPIIMTTTLQPNITSSLTSNSGHLAFLFPAETVTGPTEIRFTPLLTSQVPLDPPLGIVAFELAAYRGGQPVTSALSCPISVTWRYTDTQINGVDENALGLYRMTERGHWKRILSPQPEANQLSVHIQQLGTYLLGQGCELHLPLILAGDESVSSRTQPPAQGTIPGLPLRLPPGGSIGEQITPRPAR